ncbi:hypothetical protein TrVE_jg10508 [Triparma verrucosa]|uniref:6-hydroxymethylpterin diphosphokinase MptE-like domain-containing protein n=1 Tax=Triparma verrucosa TaxID=1606542 RepID=A0A9W7KWP5_9STRA|nr:hypothetical protein TrVE_jg10508 [Triparma verrucosa]
MSHTDIHEDYKPETSSIDHTFGVLMCISGCVLSAAAAVSMEGLVKNDDSNPNPLTLMESNVRLYSYGILSHVVVRTSGLGIHTLPYWFVGYNSWGLIALVNQAFMGLAVSFVVHRINSMAKLLSGCGSMVVSLLVSNAVFGTMITPKVVGSILIVSVSIWGYNRADTVRVDKGKTKSDRGNFVDSLISSTLGSCCGSSQRHPNYTAKGRRKRQSQTIVFIVGSLLLTALLSGVAFEGTGATKFYDTKLASGEQELTQNQKQAPPAASAPPKPKKKPCSYLGPKKARESFEEVKAQMESNKDLSRCVLIGNGPSLNNMSWDWVDTFPGVVLATNKFYIGFERFNNIKPDMYVVVNGLVAEQSSSFMQELLHEPDTFLFAGSKIADNFECDDGASDVNARPIIFKQINTKEPPCRFCEDPAKAVNLGWTVTYASLQLLYYVGCQEVVIIGMDHHFEQSGKPGETQKLGSVDVNHFDGSYFANQEWQLAGLEKSESSYKVAEKFYRDNGKKIVDATVGGHCDIFEKGDVNDLLL